MGASSMRKSSSVGQPSGRRASSTRVFDIPPAYPPARPGGARPVPSATKQARTRADDAGTNGTTKRGGNDAGRSRDGSGARLRGSPRGSVLGQVVEPELLLEA